METERLLLREFMPSDAADLFALNADPEILRYSGDVPFKSVMEVETFIRNYKEYRTTGFGRWAIIHKKTGAFLGWCGLKRNEEDMIDIGFRFKHSAWGKGYATESAQEALRVGFTKFNLDEIVGRAIRVNTASIRVLEKLGMTFWKNGSCDGLPDAAYYRITKSEYQNTKKSAK